VPPENTVMNCRPPELTLDQLLADPLKQDVMRADQADPGKLATMLHATADVFATDQTPRENSVIDRLLGQLMGLLATYYGTALCGCIRPGSQFPICKAS